LKTEDYKAAREKLFAAQKLLRRAAQAPIQKEELSNFVQQSSELDIQLKQATSSKKGAQKSDSTAKVLYKMKAANRDDFLSGSKKTEAVKRRNGASNDAARELYYNYRC